MHTIYHFNINKEKITLKYSTSAAIGFYKGAQERLRTAVVDEPSVFRAAEGILL